MGFYQLSGEERRKLVEKIHSEILEGFKNNRKSSLLAYFSNEDTYVRKAAYLSTGKIYFLEANLQEKILETLKLLLVHEHAAIRQTAVNAAGEIAMKDFRCVEFFFDTGLFDKHHAVRNAVIGSMKKSGERNPVPVLHWAKKYLHHPDKEIRREVCHGIELRGRTHPQDILPLLRELQNDRTSRVRNTLIHVIGQISYKKGCLGIVLEDLKSWNNTELVEEAIEEIIDVHERYKNFSALTQEEARKYISENYG